jgi:hypothetical protein
VENLSIHIYRSHEICCVLILKINDHEKAEDIARKFLDEFCQVLPGEEDISRLDEQQLAETMQRRCERAEASLRRWQQHLTNLKDLEAEKELEIMNAREKTKEQLEKIQKELETARMHLSDTVIASLERGEKLEILVEQSKVLSDQSKAFYTEVGECQIKTSGRY